MLVYKTELFVEKALRSALEQTFDDLEIVIVNDATPDGAMAVVERVLREYPHREPLVRIVSHPRNMGSAAARQTGIDAASGEYTIFLDSDDWVEPRMVERLYARAEDDGADIVVCDMYYEHPSRREYFPQPSPTTGRELAGALLRDKLHGSTCNKLIRRGLYYIGGVRFVPGPDMWEDLVAVVKLACFADKVSYLPEAFLHYVQSPGSLSSVYRKKQIDDIVRAVAEMEHFLKTTPYYADIKGDMEWRKLFARGICLLHTRGREQKQIAALYPEIARGRILRLHGVPPRYRMLHYLSVNGLAGAVNFTIRANVAMKSAIGRLVRKSLKKS